MELPVMHIFTHDSIGVGQDGPTHQPVEQLVSLRGIPHLIVLRPADANEVAETWRVIMQLLHQPAALVLSRQNLPTLDRNRYAPAPGVSPGAYVLAGTIIGLYKAELIYKDGPWWCAEQVELKTLDWVDWFNNRRLFEPIGNIPPVEYDMLYYQQQETPAMVVGLK